MLRSQPTLVPLTSILLDFLEKRVCAANPKTIKYFKDTNVSELGHLLSQMADRAIADTRSAGMPEVTLFKIAETGSFITNTADGQP